MRVAFMLTPSIVTGRNGSILGRRCKWKFIAV